MQIDLMRLKNNIVKEIIIDNDLTFDPDLISVSEIIRLEDVHVNGSVFKDSMDEFTTSLVVQGKMILPCAITLEEVKYPFEIEISGHLEDLLKEIGQNRKKTENTIDLLPIIWENILMEIPIRVVSKNAIPIKVEGDGWKLITDDEENDIINPEFEKLKDLL